MGLYNNNNGSLELLSGATNFSDAPIGAIYPYGGNTAPQGFLICDGTAVSRATYAELFGVIGTSFGAGDGSTTFNVPDMRESVPKGAGLTGNSNNHMDADGLAVGEFIDDRLQNHTHDFNDSLWSSHGTGGTVTLGSYQFGTSTVTDTVSNSYRKGNTTEVKAVGVNFIIKATTIALPSDFETAVTDKISANMIDSVTDGSMKAITSNAVYDALNTMETMSPGGGVVHQHWGHINCITCHWQSNTALTAMTWNTISTLTKYRPSQTLYFHATAYNQNGPAYGSLEPSGALKIFPVAACTQIYTAVTYMNP